MDEAVGFGLVCVLLIAWMLYRDRRSRRRDVLGAPSKSCARNSTQAVP